MAANAAVDGGYFPTSWGWSALGLLLGACAALIVADRFDVSRLDVLFAGGLAAVVGWVALSAVWSQSVPRTVLEAERGIVYVAGVAALLLVARRGATPWLAGGLLAALAGVSAYALSTRLFPDRLGYELELGRQLARPLGYWNALGILAAVGILHGLGFAASSGRTLPALGAAPVPALAATLYFTFSRGALVALACGLALMVAAAPRRLRLVATSLAVGPPAAVAVLLASRSDGLSRDQAPLVAAARDGHRLALAIGVLTVVSAGLALGLGRLAEAISIPRGARRAFGALLLGSAALAAVAVLVSSGGPVALVTKTFDAFRAPLPPTGGQLEGRLFSVSGNGRSDYWRVALDAYADHPVLGSGAGTYELHWNRERPTAFNARDAHSLYLESLAELGPLGLALLLAALGLPLLALRAARRTPVGVAAAGGYAAFLAHAALDWDWEVPAVTLAGLVCGAALVVAARRPEDERTLAWRVRAVPLALAAILGAFVFVAYVGNSALARSEDAAAGERYERAATQARRATRWTPWASAPWGALGEAELALGRNEGAAESFRRAVAKDPRDWSLWYGLARAAEGRTRAAALARARRLNPRSSELIALNG